MKVDTLVLGDIQTNCYVVRPSDQADSCLIIDPGFSAEPLLEFLQQENIEPARILLTHGHCDHIAGLKLLNDRYDRIPVSIGVQDAPMLTSGRKNLSLAMGVWLKFPPADQLLNAGDAIEFDGLRIDVLATPGHTAGGVSFYCPDDSIVFTGDALFAGGIGRTDLGGGDLEQLLDSIRDRLYALPDDTTVYAGHGPTTTIGLEKRTNPFVQSA